MTLKKQQYLPRTALGLAIALAGVHAQAQDDWGLEEVVVTASKRPESLQDVSMSVSAMDNQLMQDAGVSDMTDVASLAPALTVTTNSSPINASFRMRRIGNEGNIPTFEPDTGLFIDGAFRSRSGLSLGDLVDIERIEVVKGPQSTLYGKNVTAGLVSISTLAPSQEFDAMGEVSAAEDGAYSAKGYVNGGLSDTVSGRLSMSYSARDHWTENLSGAGDADNLKNYALRGQLLFEPSDDLSLRLIGGVVNRDLDAMVGEPQFGAGTQGVLGLTQMLFPASVSNTVALQDNVAGNRTIDFNDGVTEFSQDAYEATAIVDYDFGNMTLTSITGYDSYDVVSDLRDADQTQLSIARFNDTTEGSSFSQELRLTSPGGETVDWMTGLYYYHNNFTRGDGTDQDFLLGADVDELGKAMAFATLDPATQGFLLGIPEANRYAALPAILGQPGEYGDFYNEQDTDTLGAFVSATWNITEQLSLTGGLRYNAEEKDATLESSNNGTGIPLTASFPGNLGLVGKLTPNNSWQVDDSWSHVTYNLTAEYHPTDDVMTYLNYAHGFKAGGFNLGFGDSPNADRPFDEETVDTIELGWKSYLLDNKLQFNGALFYTEYTDFQSAAFLGLQFAVNNAEKVINQGIEFEALFLATERLTFNLNASYVDAYYDQYSQGSCAFGRASDSAVPGYCDLSGETLPFAPEWKANAGVQYEMPVANGDAYARLDLSYVGDHIPASSLDQRTTQDAYTLTNVRLGWRNGNWDLSAWAKNLTDEEYMVQYAPDNLMNALTADGGYQAFMGAPRSAGVTLRYTY